jgi:L-cysteine desulfidase
MLNIKTQRAYAAILREELVPAMGCTEPSAVAYAAAKAREILNCTPDRVEIQCSANIIKNIKSVIVPNTDGLRGIAAAVIAGIVGGNPSKKLEVLQSVTERDIVEIKRLLGTRFCEASLAEGIEGIHIDVTVHSDARSVEVVIKTTHTGIVLIRENGVTIFDATGPALISNSPQVDSFSARMNANSDREKYGLLNIRDILQFADTVDLEDIEDLLDRQIVMNSAIADEGLMNEYGASVGRILMARGGNDVRVRARARAAAGSDARMGGCSMPVVINSGSGNQGLTVSLPVIEYAKEWGVGHEKLIRALVVSNLVALEQKEFIGKLSAYCGAVSAAVGSGAGITYLKGGNYLDVASTITNVIATVGGILCDGAKSSCAAKIATALDCAILGHEMSMMGKCYGSGEGLVGDTVEDTIHNIGVIGSIGMRPTDIEIIRLMLEPVISSSKLVGLKR